MHDDTSSTRQRTVIEHSKFADSSPTFRRDSRKSKKWGSTRNSISEIFVRASTSVCLLRNQIDWMYVCVREREMRETMCISERAINKGCVLERGREGA